MVLRANVVEHVRARSRVLLRSRLAARLPGGRARPAHDARATEWQPVLARELPGAESFEAFRCRDDEDIFRLEIERRAARARPAAAALARSFPVRQRFAMRVATYAKSIGKVVAFTQAAFRQAFAGGRPLDATDNVLIAAAACEMHPLAV